MSFCQYRGARWSVWRLIASLQRRRVARRQLLAAGIGSRVIDHMVDVRIHNGLPLTSPARTLLGLAARLDRCSLERALDEALVVCKVVSRPQVLDVLERANGHAGASGGSSSRSTATASTTSRFAFDRDRRKDAALKSAGYDPNRLSRDHVMFESYAAVAAISAALTRARNSRTLR